MKLDDKITQLKGKLKEFIDSDSFKKIEEQAGKKAVYAFIESNLERSNMALLHKVVRFFELETIFKYCFEDNFNRSKNDETISKELPLPRNGKFFKNGFENHLYFVPNKDKETLKKESLDSLGKYIASFHFWREEVSEAA
jgi:hypothetical protein